MKHLAVILVGATALTACTNKSDVVFSQFQREAGSVIDNGSFGNATMHNTQVMTGEKDYTIDLARRFASEVPSTINFAFNSARLEPEAMAILRQQANWIRQFPEVRFKVFGHTDKVGSTSYNKRLGLRRARTVVNFLVSQGVDRRRLQAVTSFGESQPLIVTEARERRNRRTVTEVSGFVRNHPALLDGNYAQVVYREYVASAVPISTLGGTSDLSAE